MQQYITEYLNLDEKDKMLINLKNKMDDIMFIPHKIKKINDLNKLNELKIYINNLIQEQIENTTLINELRKLDA